MSTCVSSVSGRCAQADVRCCGAENTARAARNSHARTRAAAPRQGTTFAFLADAALSFVLTYASTPTFFTASSPPVVHTDTASIATTFCAVVFVPAGRGTRDAGQVTLLVGFHLGEGTADTEQGDQDTGCECKSRRCPRRCTACR